MKSMCAWCSLELVPSSIKPRDSAPITHGICDECMDNFIFQTGADLNAYLDALKAPVVVVDADGIVKTANAEARSMLGKELHELEGYPGGDVFECAYARLPEGCGNTIHCSGCTIRKAVMETHATGQSVTRKPAYLKMYRPERPQDIAFLISTEKVGDTVYLRIDEVLESDNEQSSAGQS